MQLWTIGHSTRTLEEFLDLLAAHGIELLADIRHYPGSRRYPHFGGEALAEALAGKGTGYQHFPELGGRRRPGEDSPHVLWRNPAFRGYADHMDTPGFLAAAEELAREAGDRRTAVMCSEAVWWRCHRGLLADFFKARGHTVLHILDADPAREHPWTPAARFADGVLRYSEEPAPRLPL